MISRNWQRAVARRAVAPTDIYKWPGLSFDDAGSLETGKVSIGSTDADTRPLTCDHLVFTHSLSGSDKYYWCITMTVSPDGTLLAASFSANTVLVWRLSDGLLVQRLQDQGNTHEVCSVVFSPNTRQLVSGSTDKTATVWSIKSGRALLRLEGHQSWVQRVAYSSDGSHITTGSFDRSVKIWDASSGACLHSLDLGEDVHNITFPRGGTLLAVQLKDTGAICDVHTGICVATLWHEGGVNIQLSLSHQSDRVITGTRDGKAKIWKAATGEELLELNEHKHEINHVAFSPDDAEVATASSDCTVVTCDSWTGQRRRIYRMSTAVWRVAYSLKGDYIAMGDKDGCVRVCNARSGAFLAEFKGHTKAVIDLLFVPDGHSLLSCYEMDETIRLWSIRDAIRLH